MSAFLISTGIIFVAELGDKSQLVALYLATRYRWWLVLAGVSLATLIVHLGSVIIGRAFAEILPEGVLLVVVGLSFFAFAAWSIRGDHLDDSEQHVQTVPLLGAFGVVTISFFVSELGDKTQLATISLAGGSSDTIGVWLGSTLGMVLADALAIGAGLLVGRKLPHRTIAVGAASLFVVFGVLAIARGLTA
jgi:putative Ca2+/H+ antiporter (TMEM165/GDT1 family)